MLSEQPTEKLDLGNNKKLETQVCRRCIIDETVPGHNFDANGICAYCRLQEKLEKMFPLDEKGEKAFWKIIEKIKKQGRGKKYDCVIGISGGRDSMYILYCAKKLWELRPIAVHFNDGFGNPVAGENMRKGTKKLGIELCTISSDWRESKDLRIAFLHASTPDLGTPTDIGIATALYSVALKENVKYVVIGQSFRTEGIAPLEWNYLDGRYIKTVHQTFGKVPLRPWKPLDPGFSLTPWTMAYYTLFKGIKTVPLLYYRNYIRGDAEEIIKRETDWVYPGAHYYDDLYQSLMWYVMRTKFGIDRRQYNYSSLIRSGQMKREEALESMKKNYVIEDPKVISLCIKRLGLTQEEFDAIMKLPPKTFRDYQTSYNLIKRCRIPIKILSKLNILPATTYDKYFSCG
ncbi:MAG: N-acetyl sugar amidotransferase [Candidatus Omnitrophota bacterium]|nr:N-acetyl sugar amidotransferase [Candidatus Omnitrophota bacterium]